MVITLVRQIYHLFLHTTTLHSFDIYLLLVQNFGIFCQVTLNLVSHYNFLN